MVLSPRPLLSSLWSSKFVIPALEEGQLSSTFKYGTIKIRLELLPFSRELDFSGFFFFFHVRSNEYMNPNLFVAL